MNILDYTKARLRAFLAEIDQVAESEFPYQESEEALQLLRRLFDQKLRVLEGRKLDSPDTPDEDRDSAIFAECKKALRDLFIYLPVLGFILRSTNVRNAFEIFGPLRRLTETLLPPRTDKGERPVRLVLSSEWRYAPYAFRDVLLPFVLVGLPASESANPFLIPLVGHELGHILWKRRQLYQTEVDRRRITEKCAAIIRSKWPNYARFFPDRATLSNFATVKPGREIIANLVKCVMRQSEESFADFVALKLFDRAYLLAFAYLLSPAPPPTSRSAYPKFGNRVQHLFDAATAHYGIDCPPKWLKNFELSQRSEDKKDEALGLVPAEELMSVVEMVHSSLVPELILLAKKCVEDTGLRLSDEEEIKRILRRFELGVPAHGTKGLIDIVNAAWRALEDPDFWKNKEKRLFDDKERNLREIMLKNIELFEIEQRRRER